MSAFRTESMVGEVGREAATNDDQKKKAYGEWPWRDLQLDLLHHTSRQGICRAQSAEDIEVYR